MGQFNLPNKGHRFSGQIFWKVNSKCFPSCSPIWSTNHSLSLKKKKIRFCEKVFGKIFWDSLTFRRSIDRRRLWTSHAPIDEGRFAWKIGNPYDFVANLGKPVWQKYRRLSHRENTGSKVTLLPSICPLDWTDSVSSLAWATSCWSLCYTSRWWKVLFRWLIKRNTLCLIPYSR